MLIASDILRTADQEYYTYKVSKYSEQLGYMAPEQVAVTNSDSIRITTNCIVDAVNAELTEMKRRIVELEKQLDG